MRMHWPSMVEHLSALAEEGKPFPPGVDPDKTYPIYSTTIRRKEV